MLRQDSLQVGGDAGQRGLEADRLQRTVGIAPQRMQHALRVVMEFVVVASLDAAVPVVHGVVDVADDVDDAALLERDLQPAGGVAETADGGRFDHGLPALVQGGRGGAPRGTPPLASDQNLNVKSTP